MEVDSSREVAVRAPRVSPAADDPRLAVELLHRILRDASDAIIALDPERRIVLFNKAAEEMFGHSAQDARGQLLESLLPVRFRAAHPRHFSRFIDEPVERRPMSDRSELVGLRRDGEEFPVEVTIAKVVAPDGIISTAIVRDITDRKRAERALADQALHDALTGLPNRALLSDRLVHAMQQRDHNATVTALLFIDLDRFKLVNDSLGHNVGDRLLIRVAARIEKHIRAGDTAARLGGDEFVVLSTGLESVEQAVKLAERLNHEISKPLALEGMEIYPSASIGLAVADESDDAERLLATADAAMYRAKALGGGRYEIFDQTMRAQSVERIRTESELRRALDRDQLAVWYQPIVELRTEAVIGQEALVRWHHPARGLLSADAFVPLAEHIGAIAALDAWVLNRVCADHAGHTGTIAVNLSARWLEHPTFLGSVTAAVAESGLEPERLVFEVTESVVLADLERSSDTLNRLRDLGFRVALDDFGIGFSSLSYLNRLPLDILKIDRSFVQVLDPGTRSLAMTSGIVHLGQSLGLTVVAEGVELPEQRQALLDIGCDLGQGYLFGKPRPLGQPAPAR